MDSSLSAPESGPQTSSGSVQIEIETCVKVVFLQILSNWTLSFWRWAPFDFSNSWRFNFGNSIV